MEPDAGLDVTIRVSRRARRVRLRVLPPGRVEVVVPPRFPQRRVPEVLARHAEWLDRTLARVRGRYAGEDPSRPPAQVHLPALDRCYRIEAVPGARATCRVRGDRLLLTHGDDWGLPLRRWLARSARDGLVPQLERIARLTGLSYSRVSVRGQKSRWGSCSSRGTISLNWCLLFLEPELVRYLLVHELCHTVHMNHSTAFWALVGRHEPGYRCLDARLRDAGTRVPLWARA